MGGKTILWTLMTALALVVASYALAVSFVADFQPPIVRALLSAWPLIAVSHFASGAVALIIGAFQLNVRLRTRFLWLHRWAGRVYLLAVMVGGIAGFVLALHSSGGQAARAGFGLLAIFWVINTLGAYRHIRQGNVSAHRSWMIRSYALTLAAVTLRIYLPTSLLAGFPMEVAYPAIAWLCWVPNLLVAEWGIRSGYFAPGLPSLSFKPKALRGSA